MIVLLRPGYTIYMYILLVVLSACSGCRGPTLRWVRWFTTKLQSTLVLFGLYFLYH